MKIYNSYPQSCTHDQCRWVQKLLCVLWPIFIRSRFNVCVMIHVLRAPYTTTRESRCDTLKKAYFNQMRTTSARRQAGTPHSSSRINFPWPARTCTQCYTVSLQNVLLCYLHKCEWRCGHVPGFLLEIAYALIIKNKQLAVCARGVLCVPYACLRFFAQLQPSFKFWANAPFTICVTFK